MKKRLSLMIAALFISLFAFTATGGLLYAEVQQTVVHPCYFYNTDGQLIDSVEVAQGDILLSYMAPEITDEAFSHWYEVDVYLQGRPDIIYRFNTPVMGPLYLMTYYQQVQEAMDESGSAEAEADAEVPAAEEAEGEVPEAVESEAETPAAEESEAEAPVAEEDASEAETPATEETESEDPAAEDPSPEMPPVPQEEATSEELPAEDSPVEEPRVFLKEEIDAMYPDRKISFYASWGNKPAPEFGDEITIHVELSGYEGLEYIIRWQVKHTIEQEEWEDTDVTGDACTFVLTPQTLDWFFRVAVDITDVK